ncbi:DUF4132 domain-containing protein [Dactylosporangium aurantiacum]|uniref:DUF4132 domain-containing protein n=1 Tax=Dactylosporangium aurantiacum TaxID=35754 RepID=A0A9Q9ISU2_9ACTN|nr:DUF4132 domain-containing protein [Dactylosporangium aurantiacum]MDG6107938.1 DUF4132 domain-containing protein [Dactylosporangium aurantiacum]UWZ59182.1 DUF4132 domain-containing protein [Dactylosporangium aurantiacum]
MTDDEDLLVFSAAWRKVFIPRRGGAPGPAVRLDRARGAEVLAAASDAIEARLTHPDSDPELVAAARAYLADPVTGPAAGAGVLAALVSYDVGWDRTARLAKLADLWTATRGVVFAAEAAVGAVGLDCGGYWHNGRQVPPRLVWRALDGWAYFPHWVALAGRVRAALAVATDDEHAAAVAALRGHRQHSPQRRVATTFLAPGERAWVDEDCAALAGGRADQYVGKLLWCAAATGTHLDQVAPSGTPWLARDAEALATAIDGAGTAVTPHVIAWLDTGHLDAETQQRLLGILAQLPTDEAFGALVERLDRKYVPLATLDAARRFPRRALRLLAGTDRRDAADLLRVHVLANRDLVAGELPALPTPARERVEALLADLSAVPDAPPSALPEVLVTPPWTVRQEPAKPVVLPGLTCTAAPVIRWAPGERDAWAAMRARPADWWRLETSIEEATEHYRSGSLEGHHEVTLMLTAPNDVVRSLLPGWRPKRVWDSPQWFPQLVARHELLALPAAVHLAAEDQAGCTELLLPFAAPEVATHMAATLVRLKSLRGVVLAWFDRHPADAALALVPAALGPAGPARRAAEESLRTIAQRHRDEVLAAAAEHGPDAAAAVRTLVGGSALQTLPAKIPDLPAWADPSLLPRILLKDRTAALGDEPARHLCTMLAISRPGEVYAGVPIALAALDRRSLAEFGWAVFIQWQAVGAPPKEPWPLQALEWLGDDDTVRRLSPVIRAWPGEGGHAKAVTGLDVLAGIGSDLALTHLSGIAQKAKFKGLKERATEKVAEVAARLGLTAEQLADRLVPDLGLDSTGSLRLDYGPRQFVIRFDEQLKPYVIDGTGARRKDLPKPGARDDQELAPAAYQRYTALKKDVRTIAADQIHRLETAMVTQRRWTASSFHDHLVTHPLLGQIVRRLVWTATVRDSASGAAADVAPVAFRVAEDGTYADADDDTYELPPDAMVGVAHPRRLGASLATWSAVFADYEILQPFTQLGRPVHELTADEQAAPELARFAGRKVPTTTLLGLERRGWQRGTPQDAGVQGWIWRATPTGHAVVLDLNPGIPIGAHQYAPDQEVTTVWLNDRPWGDWRPRQLSRTFAALDDITASELLRDLTEVLGP